MPTGGRDRDARAARERARLYQARRELHDGQVRRRSRDNLIAGVVGGIVIVGVIGGQVAFYTAGPGRPKPTATATATPSPTATDDLPEVVPSASSTP